MKMVDIYLYSKADSQGYKIEETFIFLVGDNIKNWFKGIEGEYIFLIVVQDREGFRVI
jgi:hypothetical protein